MANSMLGDMLLAGDYVAVEMGRLIIRSASGAEAEKLWLKQHRAKLLKEVAQLTGEPIFEYYQFSTGRYGDKRSPGVTLGYADILSGQTYRLSFNAQLTYARATKKAKQGQDLPKGHFRVSRRSKLISYWENMGFSLPRALSELHLHLNKLKEVLITAEAVKGVALDKDSCRPLELRHQELLQFVTAANEPDKSLLNDWQAFGKTTVKPRQESSISLPPKPKAGVACGAISVRGQKTASKEQRNHERASNEGYKVSLPQDSVCREVTHTRPPDQSIDDYLDEYLRATLVDRTR